MPVTPTRPLQEPTQVQPSPGKPVSVSGYTGYRIYGEEPLTRAEAVVLRMCRVSCPIIRTIPPKDLGLEKMDRSPSRSMAVELAFSR